MSSRCENVNQKVWFTETMLENSTLVHGIVYENNIKKTREQELCEPVNNVNIIPVNQ